jgi:hypothetical protein
MDTENVIDPEVVTQTRTFSVVSVFRRSWRALKANPLLYLGLALITSLLVFWFTYRFLPNFLRGGRRGMPNPNQLLAFTLREMLVMPLQGAAAYAVWQSATSQRASFVSSLLRTGRRLPFILGVGLAQAILFSMVTFGVGVAAAPFRSPVFVALALGGAWITIWIKLAVSVPVCTVEGLSPIESIRRSFKLTEGNNLRVFVVVLLLFILNRAVEKSLPYILFPVLMGFPSPALLRGLVVITLLSMLQLLVGGALYYELYAAKNAALED